jgi:Cu(I)/Ag(I) efflux system membrane fusion protein
MKHQMPTNTIRTLLGAVVVVAAIAGLTRQVHGEGQATSAASLPNAMPGMDMPKKPKQVPAATMSAILPAGYAEIKINQDVQQRIGVTVGKVEQTPLTMTIRAVGIVRPDETRVAHVHLKTEGWVEKLFVAYNGQKVRAGEPMLSIYSPTFFAAQREFLSALRVAKSGLDSEGDQKTVVDTARRRLELWDVPKDEILQLEKTGNAGKSLLLRSPISGTVLQKTAFAGQYVTVQNDLFVVADLSTVWMQAKIFQYELPHVTIGMPATVSFPASSQRTLIGRVVFIDPVVDEMSRSVQVRIELPNPSETLLPGMFGDVVISHAMGSGLTIPASAVIRTGERDVAFRVLSDGRFAPVVVKISPTRFADRFEVLEGLNAGDKVVTSGNFLIDSESRLEAGAGSMADMPGMAAPAKADSPEASDKK